MNYGTMGENGREFRSKTEEPWGKLTNDRLDQIASKRDQLEREIRQTHRIIKDLSAQYSSL